MSKIYNINFWIENDPPPFATFSKAHPLWRRHPSLMMTNILFSLKAGSAQAGGKRKHTLEYTLSIYELSVKNQN